MLLQEKKSNYFSISIFGAVFLSVLCIQTRKSDLVNVKEMLRAKSFAYMCSVQA